MAPIDEDEQAQDQNDEPTRKRVRFASLLDANQVIEMCIVTSNDPEALQMMFPPEFTYHVVGKEQTIEGFDHLKVSICFNAFDFSCLVEIQSKDANAKQSIANLREQLQPSLPAEIFDDRRGFLQRVLSSGEQFSPPGRCVKEYTRRVQRDQRDDCDEQQEEKEVQQKDEQEEETFEIYECAFENNPKASRLHENLQKTSRWFIEGADDIDVEDPRWVLYLIYKVVKCKSNSASEQSGIHTAEPCAQDRHLHIVGFTTLFKFHNPLGRRALSPQQDETHRICQVLVFPPFQRQGHGEMLIKTINAIAVANPKVYEITVEDPVPGFQKLRDILDVRSCLDHKFFNVAPCESLNNHSLPVAQGTQSLTNDVIQHVQRTLKLTRGQVHRCYEILKLRFVETQNEDELKKYRLEVKKRLFKLHAEDLEAMASSERRKAFLEKEFQELYEYYESILKRLALVN